MTDSPPTPHTLVPMEKSSETPAIIMTTMQEVKPLERRPLTHKKSYRSTPAISSMLKTPLGTENQFLNNLMSRPLSNRQRAEIQLDSILNDPEASLPAFARRTSDQLSEDHTSIEEVSKLLNTQPFIIERLVRKVYSTESNHDELQSLNKMQLHKLTRVLNGTMDVRALLFFIVLAGEDDQYISARDLSEFYEQYLKHLKTFDSDRLQEVIPVLLQKFHLDLKPRIDYEEFFSIVSKDSTLLQTLSQFTVHPTWFVKPSAASTKPPTKLHRLFANLCWQQSIYEHQKNKLTVDYIKDNLSRLIVFLLYLLVNLALFLYVVIYRSAVTKSNVLVVLARIGGMLLNSNCAFVIVLMLKQTILLIRSNVLLRKLIPVDDHIDFHKIVGRVIAGLAILHTIAHMANFGRMTDYSWATFMFTTRPDIGWVGGFAPLSGIILCIILITIVVCSMQWIRRGGHFQVFYWTHLLYFPFFVFLIIHASSFWKWVVGPLAIFLLEKAYSILTRYSSRSGRTYLHSATIEQSNVVSLNIHRPKNFTFKPGDYITINLPRVALYEFHPYTISSAPEETKYLTIHMQAVGNWTKSVYERFKTMSEADVQDNHLTVHRADLHPEQGMVELNENTEEHPPKNDASDSDYEESESDLSKSTTKTAKREPVVINGPYSSCARYVFDCKHVVLIGGGIGITPYASILSSLMAQFRASRIVCKHCQGINYHSKGLVENRQLKKVDFIWVNRDQKNFEWFLNLLRQFEQEQEYYLASNSDEQRFLDIHLYFTEIKHDENIGNVPLDLISKVWAQVAGEDIFTSLKSKTYVGRPKWDEVFDRLVSGENASTANDVNVFFCGPATMASAIRQHCTKYRFRFYEEKF